MKLSKNYFCIYYHKKHLIIKYHEKEYYAVEAI